MALAKTEEEWAERLRAYLKVELKKADVGYVELAKRLKKAGVDRQVRSWEKTSDHAPTWIELSDPRTLRRAAGTEARR